MSFAWLITLARRLVMVASILLILFAAYLSIGRQFMPAVASYKGQMETRLSEAFGIPVSIESLTGYFDGFNPAIELQGLRFNVLEPDPALPSSGQGLLFERAIIILDMAETILQRQLELNNFSIEGLDVSAKRTESGAWQLSGISLEGGGTLDLELVYETIQRVEGLQLNNINLELQLSEDSGYRFDNVSATIQNASGNHFIHVNAGVPDIDGEVLLSLEVTGRSLDEIAGTVHASLPENDYSRLTEDVRFGRLVLGGLVGGGQAWLNLDSGQIRSIVFQPRIERLSFALEDGEPLIIDDLSGRARLSLNRFSQAWEFAANNLALSWNGRRWQEADSHVLFRPGESVQLHAEALDVGILREMALTSGLAPEAVTNQLERFQPRGILRNLSLSVPLEADTTEHLSLTANLDSVGVESANGSPAMTGINGYLEIDYDFEEGVINGMGEVESENFGIHIGNVFTDSWSYDYVNGRVNFRVRTGAEQEFKLSSSVIVAESAIVDGRAQFSSTIKRGPNGERSSDFALLAGALRADGNLKSSYLPDGPRINPGLYRTMEWLDGALLDGAVFQSGVIFSGPIHRGSPAQEKMFQAFFNFNEADVRYIEEWPDLNDVAGTVIVKNRSTSISLEGGRTMGLAIGPTTASISEGEDGQLWLSIDGEASGTSQAGLDFLNVAPLDATLGDTMSTWQAQGNVDAKVDLHIPLGGGGLPPQVEISASLADNQLILPEYQLEFEEVNGVINFDSIAGLDDSLLSARLFAGDADFSLESQRNEAAEFVTVIQVDGVADSQSLAAWPGQSGFVRDLLHRSDGSFGYQAELRVQEGSTRLRINSDLQGLAINLPQPFRKQPEQTQPLNLLLDIDRQQARLEGVLGSELSMRINVMDDELDGIVYAGTMPGIANPWEPETEAPGLELRGNLDVFSVSEWLAMLDATDSVESPARDLTRWIASVRLDVGSLDVFGQQLESVNVRIEDLAGTDYWTVALDSEAVAGSVLIPFDREEYIEAFLAYLRLPGAEQQDQEAGRAAADTDGVSSDSAAEAAEEVEPVDALAQLDPRELPRLRFFTGELSIGERNFGLGRFTLDPEADGARFSDLIVDFRGFRVGMADDEPSFFWSFDGNQHHSYLTGIVLADNIAEVLRANGFAASLESDSARFDTQLDWTGSPAFLRAESLSGRVVLNIEDGRFLQGGGPGALKLISIINLNAMFRRMRFGDDMLRRGLAYEEITGDLSLEQGIVTINNQLVITGPSSVYQISGAVDLAAQTIDGRMLITLPVSDNIPWLGLLGAISGTLNPAAAIGVYLFERIFGDQVDSLTSAQYRLEGPWEGLEPEFEQAFGSAPEATETGAAQAGGQNQTTRVQ